jgi:hypothetical protein
MLSLEISIDEIIPLDELKQIEEKHKKGGYVHLADCLWQFLINHSARIIGFRGELEQREGKQIPLDSVIGLYILDNKTVDMKLDMRDQKREIENTIWYEHEKGRPIPASEIEKDWVNKYAAAWRIHRVREIMYVFSQNKQEYMELIK